MTTRLAKKRKINDLVNNAPTKKARVKHMKELAKEMGKPVTAEHEQHILPIDISFDDSPAEQQPSQTT